MRSTAGASNEFGVFEQGHAKEVLNSPGGTEAGFFVKANRPFERRGRVQADSLAVSLLEIRFRAHEPSRCNIGPLQGGKNRHSPNMPFGVAGMASNGADNFIGFLDCNKYGHLLKAFG